MVCLERFEKCSILLFQTQDHIMLEHVADLFKSFQLGLDHDRNSVHFIKVQSKYYFYLAWHYISRELYPDFRLWHV